MTSAKVMLKGSDRDLGWWQFVHLPRVGELLAITLNEAPATFEVAGIIHAPIVTDAAASMKRSAPYTIVVVEEPRPVGL